MATIDARESVQRTREYYDGDAAQVYKLLWQDNIHMGTWDRDGLTLNEAMDRTNEVMTEDLGLTKESVVLEAGCGFGKTARRIAERYGCRVIGISVGEKELAVARERTREAGVDDRCEFRVGDYHDLAFEDGTFDVVFSQDAFVHGADKARIIAEAFRVLKPGGRLVFSDLLLRKGIPEASEKHVRERISVPTFWDAPDYVDAMKEAGFRVLKNEDWTVNVALTYRALAARVREHADALARATSDAFVEKTVSGYDFSAEAAENRHLGQGFFAAEKPA